MHRRHFSLLVAAATVAALGAAASLRARAQTENPWGSDWGDFRRPLARVTTVVLDPGHGGSDAGASNAAGMVEKKLALDIAEEAADRIQRELGARVVLTRESDVAATPEERIAAANYARGDLFISIHASASPSPDMRGIAVYYPEDLPAGRRPKRAAPHLWTEIHRRYVFDSKRLAETLARSTTEATEMPLHGVHAAPLTPLEGAEMPAVLIEVGFLTNTEDAAALGDERNRVLLADAIRQAVLDYDTALATRDER